MRSFLEVVAVFLIVPCLALSAFEGIGSTLAFVQVGASTEYWRLVERADVNAVVAGVWAIVYLLARRS